MPQTKTIDSYISDFPVEVQSILRKVRQVIKETAPDAVETFSYGIPTFDLAGKHLVHFAGYKHHIGFYPTSSGIAAFQQELSPYKSSKGAVQFPFDQPVLYDLIRKIVQFRVDEVRSK